MRLIGWHSIGPLGELLQQTKPMRGWRSSGGGTAGFTLFALFDSP